MDKCIERIQLHLPEPLYRDILAEAAEHDIAASAMVRHVMEQYLYGTRGKRASLRPDEERES